MKEKCQHCNERVASAPRKLCQRCSRNPDIKARYPLTSKFAQCGAVRGVTSSGNGSKARDKNIPPSVPCVAQPGSEQKIQILERRAELGQPLFHPLDRLPNGVD